VDGNTSTIVRTITGADVRNGVYTERLKARTA
jgi:hypothetical protein